MNGPPALEDERGDLVGQLGRLHKAAEGADHLALGRQTSRLNVGLALEFRLELAYLLALRTAQGETYRSDGYNTSCFFSVLSTAQALRLTA
jgi:hypothetical protein